MNKTVIPGTRRLLCNSGLPACWWPYAGPCYCFLRNVMLDENNESSYYEQRGVHFPGKVLPFGCLVYYLPPPTTDHRAKAAPTLRPAIFLGYRTPPGGLWAGDYLVADFDTFQGLSMHTDAEPGIFKNCRAQITRTVKWTPHGSYFPLFVRSVEHNETIDGLDMAMLQMKRERCRRKREKLPALDAALSQKLADFARTTEAENLT